MSVSLVENVSAVITVDGCICVSVAPFQCSDCCGLMSVSLV